MEMMKADMENCTAGVGKNEQSSGSAGGYTPVNIDCFIAKYNASQHLCTGDDDDSAGENEKS